MTILLFLSCQTKKDKKQVEEIEIQELTILEKVAHAHGYEHWKNISRLKFTFNVDRDSSHFERTWSWKTKTNDITSITETDTLNYNRKTMDSTANAVNGGFINDKFWLMVPYNLIWDKNNITHEHIQESEAPISKKSMQKLTIVYGNEGGYTPGDAYDLYFEDDYLIKEWVFRRGNQEEPSMSTTWEKYVDMDGLIIATMHQNEEGNFKLHFTGIETDTK